MPIPFPPAGCKTAYIQDSAVLIVPEGASLASLCVKCGKAAAVQVSKTYHWRDWQPSTRRFGTQVLGLIGLIFFRLRAFDTPVSIDIPLCRAHRSKQIVRRWAGIGLTSIGLALLPFSVKSIEVRTPLEVLTRIGTVATILGGLLVLFLGVHILSLVELNDRFAAYTGFGIEYMQKIPSDTEIFSPKRTGMTSNS